MKKYINLKNLALAVVLTIGISCDSADQDNEPVASSADYPVASFELMNSEVGDRDGGVVRVKVSLDKMLTAGVSFTATQVGGTATEGEDFTIMGTSVLAFSNEAYVDIQINPDIVIEGDETIVIQMTAPSLANRYLLNPSTVFPSFTINITDYVFCLWTLDARDTYGDGWNGGYILLETEGESFQYAADGPQSLFDIAVTVGADYKFTYVSGGGTGGGPGWESENYYLLTGPDGTEYEDGTQNYSGIPTPGVITSGVSSCN